MTGMTRSDKFIPWYFVLFFLWVAAVDTVMVTLAVRTHTGTVTDHPYEKGLAYNRVVQAETVQEKLGWAASIDLKDGRLRVAIKDARGVVLTPDRLTARIRRPTQEGMDFEVTLENGEAPLSFPLEGLWEIRIFARVGEQSYQQSKRVVIE